MKHDNQPEDRSLGKSADQSEVRQPAGRDFEKAVAALREVIGKLEAERQLDAENIRRHADASRERIETIGVVEDQFIKYIDDARKMNAEMFDNLAAAFRQLCGEFREQENERLASLEGQAKSLIGSEVETQQPAPKRIRAVE